MARQEKTQIECMKEMFMKTREDDIKTREEDRQERQQAEEGIERGERLRIDGKGRKKLGYREGKNDSYRCCSS